MFNAPYSSEYNPVERLWCYAKYNFKKKMVAVSDYKNQVKIQRIVTESVREVNSDSLRKHVLRCCLRMKDHLLINESAINN